MALKRLKTVMLLALLVTGLAPALARAAEFSATVVTRQNAKETQGKIYLQGEKLRREDRSPEGLTITIARPDRQVMWLLVPGQKKYMEIPFRQSDLGQVMTMPQGGGQMKLLGREVVNGYETEKYETTVTGEGRSAKHFLWVSRKLGVPIKIASEDGKFSMEYRNIREGRLPAGVFELPAGYQKMALPKTPQGAPQGAPQAPPRGR